MTVVRQSELEDLDGFQVDWDQFLIPYSLGCDVVDAFVLPLREACEAEDRLTVVAIVWFMMLANGLPLPATTYSRRCDLLKVQSLVRSLSFEARSGEVEHLHEVLIQVSRAAGIYGPHARFQPGSSEADVVRGPLAIRPSKS